MAINVSNQVPTGSPLPNAGGSWIQQRNALRALGARNAARKPAPVQQQQAALPPVAPQPTAQPAPQPLVQPMAAPKPPTFPGLVTNLVNTSLASSPVAGSAAGGLMNVGQQGSPAAQGYASQGAAYGAGSIPIAAQANDIAKQFGQRYADVGQQGAKFEAGQLTTGTTPVAEGNAAVTAQSVAAQQGALAQGEQAALQGIGYGLTGQQQAANAANQAAGTELSSTGQQLTGLNEAGGLGLQAQGLQQQGLTSAAGFAQPQPYGLTSQPYFPLGDSYGGGGNNGALDRATLAGQIQGAQALGAAPGSAAASNVQTAGTAQTGAAATAYGQYYQQALSVNTALNQVQSLGNLALQTAQGGNINPFQMAAGNSTLAQVRRQLSSPAQGTFDQTMATFQGALSQLFSSSSDVTPTQVSAWSTQISNGTMPLATLQAIYQQAIKEGNLRLNNILQTGGSAYQQLQTSGAQPQGANQPQNASSNVFNW